MSDLNNRNTGADFNSRMPRRSTNSWLVPTIVVIVILAALAFAYSNHWFASTSETAVHPATTATPMATPPATPMATTTPATPMATTTPATPMATPPATPSGAAKP